MPRTSAPPEWAEGVASVAVRNLTAPALLSLSKEQGLSLSLSEMRAIQRHFRRVGREPTDVELAGIAQSWSEHCSYKSSRRFLRKAFAGLRPPDRVLGTGDAGVMTLHDGGAYALRIESHNHPSAVEPYGGAATGIGGILRDVLAVGAKPVALADPLFFGPLDLPLGEIPSGVKSPRYLMDGVVAGIRDYGNRVGVPTVTGGVYFGPAYTVNPLVNVGCVGLLPRKRLLPNRATATGEKIILAGGLTGRDGIGGVSFASRELTERSEEESRGAVQLGNPIMKEPLIHACLEAADRGLIRGIKDLGGGGLATASGELAHAGGFGTRIDLDRVPLRETGLRPWEIWISESQERMVLTTRPRDVRKLLAVFERHDVPATGVGEVVPQGTESLYFRERLAGQLDLKFRIDAPTPVRRTRLREPGRGSAEPEDSPADLIRRLVLDLDSTSREPVLRGYDHEVQGRTVLNPLQGRVESPSHGDASVIRTSEDGWGGLALTVATQPAACQEDPRGGARWMVEEAARNLYAVGGRPDSLTDCLNFGNPEDPVVLGDFDQVTRGLAEAARRFGFAVPSGNVSFYNGGLGSAIPPTPVVLAVGIVEDLRTLTSSDFKIVGDPLYLVGKSAPAMGGSLWARREGRRNLAIPPLDEVGVRRRGEKLQSARERGWIRACHDISDGGLACTLAEMAFGGGLGFSVDLAVLGLRNALLALAAEGGSRWVVEVETDKATEFEGLLEGEPHVRLGVVAPRGGRFTWKSGIISSVDLDGLYAEWREGLNRARAAPP